MRKTKTSHKKPNASTIAFWRLFLNYEEVRRTDMELTICRAVLHTTEDRRHRGMGSKRLDWHIEAGRIRYNATNHRYSLTKIGIDYILERGIVKEIPQDVYIRCAEQKLKNI